MSERKIQNSEFYYREIPNEEDVLALLGAEYIQYYGAAEKGEFSARRHFHNLLEIGICRQGVGTVMIDGKRYEYEAGCVVMIPKSIPHVIISQEGEKSFWEYIYVNPAVFLEKKVHVGNRDRNLYLDLIELHPFFKEKDEVPFLASEINLIMDQMRTQGYGYRQCIRGLLYALLMEIVKINYAKGKRISMAVAPKDDKSRKIAGALDYIEAHFSERIRVEDIAQAVYISPTYLRKLFMEYCQMPPMQYLNYVRIHAACKLLRKTDDNISEVSQKVGYDNMSTFLNNFKLVTGETPKQWKDKATETE